VFVVLRGTSFGTAIFAQVVMGCGICGFSRAAVAHEVHDTSYIHTRYLLKILQAREVPLLRPDYILNQYFNTALPLAKFQEVSQSYFLDPQELTVSESDLLLVISVSYCWVSADHPDPHRYHLATIAQLVKRFCDENSNNAVKNYAMPGVDFGDFRNYYQEHGFCFGAGDGLWTGIFLDWCCLPQDKPIGSRTNEENRLFKLALRKINVWYAHQNTITWMLTSLPLGTSRADYHDSGWTTFERTVASILSPQFALLDIDSDIREKLIDPQGEFLVNVPSCWGGDQLFKSVDVDYL